MSFSESMNFTSEPTEQESPVGQEILNNPESFSATAELSEYASDMEKLLVCEIEELRYSTDTTSLETVSKAKSILENFRKKVQDVLQVATLTAAMLGPTQAHGATSEQVQEAFDSPESYEQVIQEHIAQLKNELFTDTKETFFALLGRKDSLEEIAKMEGGDRAVNVSQTGDELLNTALNASNILNREDTTIKNIKGYFTDNPITKVFLHNHPYAVPQEELHISDEDVQLMISGKKPPAVFPPSALDFNYSLVDSTKNIDGIGYVVEPSGVWKYDIDELNPNVIKRNVIQKKFQKEAEEVYAKYSSLNPGFLDEIKNLGQLQYFEYFEKYHPELAEKVKAIEEAMNQEIKSAFDKDFLSAGIQIETIGDSIREASLKGENTTELINRFVNTATNVGFYVEYTANDGTVIAPKKKDRAEDEVEKIDK